MISLIIAAQLMASPCAIVHTHKAHHTPQQSVICPIMPPCNNGAKDNDITPLYPIPRGYLSMLDMPTSPLDTPAVGDWLAPGYAYQIPVSQGSGSPVQSPVYIPPRKVHATPEIGLPGWFLGVTVLVGICLCIHGAKGVTNHE
jgi:hypothetical protein